MPTYEYSCLDCGERFERILRISENKIPQCCSACSSNRTEKRITTCNFILSGDNWPGKAIRIKRQMAEKNARLDTKSAARSHDAPGMKLVPNVGGERVDSWSEAQRLAASKGKDASTYEALTKTELKR
jgi:putative FmdB family regulatory protein